MNIDAEPSRLNQHIAIVRGQFVRSNAVRALPLLTILFACAPDISPDELPQLTPVKTELFLASVQEQLEGLRAEVDEDPLDVKKASKLGMAYLAYQLDNASEVALQRARLLRPREFKWMYYHAEALKRLGRFDEAILELKRALARKPGNDSAQVRLGMLYSQMGDLDAAADLLKPVVKNDPDNVEARLALARVFLRTDDVGSARTHLEYLLEQVGHAGPIYFALADTWRRVGEREKATKYHMLFDKYRNVGVPVRDDLMSAVHKLDISEKPLLREARRLNQLGRIDEAMQLLHEALDRNPRSLTAHAALIGAYGAMKKFDEVEKQYQLALESGPPTAPLLLSLGRARFYQSRLPEAQRALEEALEFNPRDASTMTWLGLVRLQQGNVETGIKFLGDALTIDPKQTMARHNLANVLHSLGREEEALVHFRELVGVEDQHTPRVWRQMGEAYLRLGHAADAREALLAGVDSANGQNDKVESQRIAALLARIPE